MIYLASSNPNKLREFQDLLPNCQLVLLNKNILDKLKDIETGSTFLENAFFKAQAAQKLVKESVIADDSGLVIEALGGFPGLYSARFANNESYEVKNQLILDKLVSIKNRNAYFSCAVVLITKEGEIYQGEGKMEGSIAFEARGKNGFGYDPIFIPKNYKKSSAELTAKEKNAISHRALALQDLLSKIPETLAKKEGLYK
ncbi:RdgB/HAM1 family non-canonical purine NTP pyrophosphatase [bacterium]|nr:RdgB/HAM1 family non-canonical purine NTP pyrophosphatase [bacterium]